MPVGAEVSRQRPVTQAKRRQQAPFRAAIMIEKSIIGPGKNLAGGQPTPNLTDHSVLHRQI